MITGTMANQISLRCHTTSGEEIITDNYYHILYYESAPTSDLGKVSVNILYTKNGIIEPEDLKSALLNRYRSSLTIRAKLLWLENTINHYSGKIYPLEKIKQIYNVAKNNALSIHIDGARLLNACAANKIRPSVYSHYADSMMVSFSKGLGAPAGAVLLGDEPFIEKAKTYQKWYGGGLHQSGILAAAALFAIKNNTERLQEDNDNAKLLGNLLAEEKKIKVLLHLLDTNIVMFSVRNLNMSALKFVSILKSHGVLLYPWDEYTVRAVTHKDISKSCVISASEIIRKVVSTLSNSY